MVTMERRDDVAVLCPHCDQELHTVWFQEISGFAGRRYVYFCPDCHRVLGVSHRKGFFMG
ncbi:MAG: hypothetical protein PVF27_10315 [Gemmatimonadales bacterium]|jgi:hypothetical protein